MAEESRNAVIKGTVLRKLIAERDITQKELAIEAGVTHHRICNLARVDTVNKVKQSTADKIAKALNVSTGVLAGKEEEGTELNENEAVVIDMFRKLDPIRRAEALLEMKKLLDKSSQ